jgi:ectoine hydroxylase-related dioxygenase (phytanoyl-CoA dioxygenase family)
MADPGEFSKNYTTEGDGGNFFGDYCNWARIPEYRSFFFDSPAGEMAAELMQSQTVRIFHEHVLVKEPGTSNPTPWHHDQPYYCVDGKQVVSFWIPLDTVPQATCPEFISGSHAWGKWFLPRKFSGVDYNYTEEWLEPIPDIENQREQYDIRSWDLEPGDAIAFHYLTVHGAPPNKSKKLRRRGFAARWLGDDTTYAQRSGDISPPFPGLEKRLKVGDPLDTDEFPQVWPRN